jgi:hypothetical protein
MLLQLLLRILFPLCADFKKNILMVFTLEEVYCLHTQTIYYTSLSSSSSSSGKRRRMLMHMVVGVLHTRPAASTTPRTNNVSIFSRSKQIDVVCNIVLTIVGVMVIIR